MAVDNVSKYVRMMNAYAAGGNGITDRIQSTDTDSTQEAGDATDVSGNNGLSFVDTLKDKLDQVNADQLEADAVTEAFLRGDDVDVTQMMITSAEANQSLQLAIQVRNKLVEAFQEINRMQL